MGGSRGDGKPMRRPNASSPSSEAAGIVSAMPAEIHSPSPLLAVQLAPSLTDGARRPQPTPGGLARLRVASLALGSAAPVRLQRHLRPTTRQALRAGSQPKIRFQLSAGLYGVDSATPPVPHSQR